MRVTFVVAVALCVACSALINQKVARELVSGTCGENAKFFFDNETGLMIINGTGEMEDYDPGGAPWVSLRKKIKTLVIEDGITKVSRNGFYGCSEMTSVSFPESVVTIQPFAFQSCKSLTSVLIPKNVSMVCPGAFSHCSSLVLIDVDKDNTNYISDNGILFKHNVHKGLDIVVFPAGKRDTSYVIPSNVNMISNYAFMGCRNLTSVTIPTSVTLIGGYCFDYVGITSIEIPSTVTSIGTGLFNTCVDLKKAVIGSGIKKIPEKTFKSCSRLTSVTIPPGVKTIGSEAFDSCESLESVTIPANVSVIEDNAFKQCHKLKSITFLGSTAPQCPENIFDECEKFVGPCVPSSYNSTLFCGKAVDSCPISGASRISNSLFFIVMNAIVILISIMLA